MKPFYLLKILLLVLLSVSCNNAIALYINADISSMESGKSFFLSHTSTTQIKLIYIILVPTKLINQVTKNMGHLSITARLFLLH